MNKYREEKIIWLTYFDCLLDRRHGRRVSQSLCINDPKPNEFLEVCKKLNMECNYIDKKYPRTWYKGSGYIVIRNSSIKKNVLLKIIAKEIKIVRTSMESATDQK